MPHYGACTRARESQLPSLRAAATEAREPPACGSQQQKPGHRNKEQHRLTAARESPHQQQRLRVAGKKYSTNKNKNLWFLGSQHRAPELGFDQKTLQAGANIQPVTSGGLLQAVSSPVFPGPVQGVRDPGCFSRPCARGLACESCPGSKLESPWPTAVRQGGEWIQPASQDLGAEVGSLPSLPLCDPVFPENPFLCSKINIWPSTRHAKMSLYLGAHG